MYGTIIIYKYRLVLMILSRVEYLKYYLIIAVFTVPVVKKKYIELLLSMYICTVLTY